MSNVIQVVLSNARHPEYGQFTIPFPIPQDAYDDMVEALKNMEIGDPILQDCHVDELESSYSILVKHPFTDSGITVIRDKNNSIQPADLLNDPRALDCWRGQMAQNIQEAESSNQLFYMVTKSYRLAFLKHTAGYVDSALYLSQMDEIDRKLRELRKLRRRLLEAAGEDRQIHDTERMMEYLEDGPEWLDEVPAELFGELIERIIIISPERLKFRLLNGMELAENIERTVR